MYKYRPESISEYVFATQALRDDITPYLQGKSLVPLILHGSYGTGKSLLASLIPKEIDGKDVKVKKIHAEDLNNAQEVRKHFLRPAQFDRLFATEGQEFNYTIIEEVNFDPKAKGAVRDCMDTMAMRELFIFTTNEINKIDEGLKSRANIVEVLPAPPLAFLPRAQYILNAEGINLDEALIVEVLTAVYNYDCDNRSYYKALDKIINK